MAHGFKLLLDASSDPEFSNYAKNCIKEYFKDVTPEYIGRIAAEMLVQSNSEGSGNGNFLSDLIRKEVTRRVDAILPTYTGWGGSTSAKAKELVDREIRLLLSEKINAIVTDQVIRSAIEIAVKEKVSKLIGEA